MVREVDVVVVVVVVVVVSFKFLGKLSPLAAVSVQNRSNKIWDGNWA